jgi:taurine dioxygenase
MKIERLGPTCGVRIEGVDAANLDDATFAEIRRLFLENYVVALRGQSLNEEQVIALSRRFGPLEPHVLKEFHHGAHPEILMLSTVTEAGKPKGLADAGSYWHSDVSYKAKPSRASGLYAVEVPEEGGDTLFCDMVAAYEALPEATKRRLHGLKAAHDYEHRMKLQVAAFGVRKPLTEEQKRETPEVLHPVVRTHPETGRKALYVNPGFTVRIEGLSERESEALKEELFAHCLQDRFRFAYKWRAGDALIWDNACVMHKATVTELPPGSRRTMWRTIVSGDAPF